MAMKIRFDLKVVRKLGVEILSKVREKSIKDNTLRASIRSVWNTGSKHGLAMS